MVNVRFDSREQLISCSNLLRFRFPGEIRITQECQLELAFRRDNFDASVEEAVVERLLWAWMTAHALDGRQATIVSPMRDEPNCTEKRA